MVRVRPNEARIVDEILGKGEFPINILDPLFPKLEKQALNVHVAFYRIIYGLELVAQWHEHFGNNPNAATLVGGAAAAQNFRPGTNPPGTDQGHYVQAAVGGNGGVTFAQLPATLQRLFGHTSFVLREHNRGIHRSIDKAQEFLIGQYNANVVQNNVRFDTWFNAELAIDFCNDVLQRIDNDVCGGRFQYSKCEDQDIADYCFTVQTMRNGLQQKMGTGNTGPAFILDRNNFKPLEPSPEDY